MSAPIPSSAAIIAANRDADLRERARALGAALGYSQTEVDAEFHRVVLAPINGGESTLATVYEYVSGQYAQALAKVPPKPGLDPAGVLDGQIMDALKSAMPPKPQAETI